MLQGQIIKETKGVRFITLVTNTPIYMPYIITLFEKVVKAWNTQDFITQIY